jgi:hypothetical protein
MDVTDLMRQCNGKTPPSKALYRILCLAASYLCLCGLFFWLSLRANQEGAHWRMNGKIVGLLNHSRVPFGHRVVAAIGSKPLHHLTFS